MLQKAHAALLSHDLHELEGKTLFLPGRSSAVLHMWVCTTIYTDKDRASFSREPRRCGNDRLRSDGTDGYYRVVTLYVTRIGWLVAGTRIDRV